VGGWFCVGGTLGQGETRVSEGRRNVDPCLRDLRRGLERRTGVQGAFVQGARLKKKLLSSQGKAGDTRKEIYTKKKKICEGGRREAPWEGVAQNRRGPTWGGVIRIASLREKTGIEFFRKKGLGKRGAPRQRQLNRLGKSVLSAGLIQSRKTNGASNDQKKCWGTLFGGKVRGPN